MGDRDGHPGDCRGGSPPSRPWRVALGPEWRLVCPVRPSRHPLAGGGTPHSAVDAWSVHDLLWGPACSACGSLAKSSPPTIIRRGIGPFRSSGFALISPCCYVRP